MGFFFGIGLIFFFAKSLDLHVIYLILPLYFKTFVVFFIHMRKELAISQEVLKRLAQIDKKLLEHDNVIEDLVHNLIPLLEEQPLEEKPPMGFNP